MHQARKHSRGQPEPDSHLSHHFKSIGCPTCHAGKELWLPPFAEMGRLNNLLSSHSCEGAGLGVEPRQPGLRVLQCQCKLLPRGDPFPRSTSFSISYLSSKVRVLGERLHHGAHVRGRDDVLHQLGVFRNLLEERLHFWAIEHP